MSSDGFSCLHCGPLAFRPDRQGWRRVGRTGLTEGGRTVERCPRTRTGGRRPERPRIHRRPLRDLTVPDSPSTSSPPASHAGVTLNAGRLARQAPALRAPARLGGAAIPPDLVDYARLLVTRQRRKGCESLCQTRDALADGRRTAGVNRRIRPALHRDDDVETGFGDRHIPTGRGLIRVIQV